ncbi:amidohydrolase family protein [Aliiglaciecola sp. CAU 1673]|uniref:amidohydrolase family protein n=1 Tax=Aliiglaciecola sp. CAU 1673 TaxID=3032595 RepID=UPI0023DC9A92|nr:amidohydrolase family protein [Aliiglaciecola sp. CAU 1673]MDF2178829.1 amidohydrolase family protein [Aliiglaciecola sp. CAU 1673]
MKKLMLLAGLFSFAVQAENLAVVGGYTHTLSAQGSLQEATILIKDGRIESVKSGNEVPSGYRVIDAKGKIVTPGLIGAYTALGLVEVESSAGPVDAEFEREDYEGLGAAFDVSYAINPDSSLFAISRIEGFTLAASAMLDTGTLFQGRGAIIRLAGEQPVVKAKAFMSLALDNSSVEALGGSRAVIWPELEAAFEEAASLKGKPLGVSDEFYGTLSRADVNALIPVVAGQMPLVVRANRAADIRQLIALKQRHPALKMVLLGAIEGWRVASELAEANIPVILDPESNLPYSFDQLGATQANAGRLDNAGVLVAIGINTHNIRLATQHAGNAVANGMSWLDGLSALSLNVAKIYGIDADYGSLEQGKVADVVIWSGDPLEVMEAPLVVIINGEQVNMDSRQTKLRDRYLSLKQDKPMGYVRP